MRFEYFLALWSSVGKKEALICVQENLKPLKAVRTQNTKHKTFIFVIYDFSGRPPNLDVRYSKVPTIKIALLKVDIRIETKSSSHYPQQ